jgi:hypothetical protein
LGAPLFGRAEVLDVRNFDVIIRSAHDA